MIIDADNKKKLLELQKELKKNQSTSKSKMEIAITEDEDIKRVLSIVQLNGKLMLDDQVTYMKYKGISFNHVSEAEAKEYLSKNTYYYKVTSFRKNFKKKDNKYVNLDFGILNDLATVDMYLRYILIKMNLDIEHTLKSLLVSTITDSNSEDGYSIVVEYDEYCKSKLVEEYPNFDESKYDPVDKKIMSRNKDIQGYHYDLYAKRKINPPIWVLIELMSFGELIRFIEFYYEKNKRNRTLFKEAYELLKYTKNIRDSAAHSRPLILNISSKEEIKPTQAVTEYAQASNVAKLDRKRVISNKKIHDFICMLIIHDRYIESPAMKKERKNELAKLIKRCSKRKEFYEGQVDLQKVYEIFYKTVANYN